MEIVKLFHIFFNYEDALYERVDPNTVRGITIRESEVKTHDGIPVIRPKVVKSQ